MPLRDGSVGVERVVGDLRTVGREWPREQVQGLAGWLEYGRSRAVEVDDDDGRAAAVRGGCHHCPRSVVGHPVATRVELTERALVRAVDVGDETRPSLDSPPNRPKTMVPSSSRRLGCRAARVGALPESSASPATTADQRFTRAVIMVPTSSFLLRDRPYESRPSIASGRSPEAHCRAFRVHPGKLLTVGASGTVAARKPRFAQADALRSPSSP